MGNIESYKDFKVNDGVGDIESLPENFNFDIDETRWDKADWEIRLDDLLAGQMAKGLLTLPDGRPITSFAYSKDGNFLIGAVAPVEKMTISQVKKQGNDVETLIMFRDEYNNVVQPPLTEFTFFELSLKNRRAFNHVSKQKAIDRVFLYLLVDASGSMNGFMPDVKISAKKFMNKMPKGVACSVSAFNGHLIPLGKAGTRCDEFGPHLDTIQANGYTAIYTSLLETVRDIKKRTVNKPDIKPLIVVITDGGNNDSVSKQTVVNALKGTNATTFVYWAGLSDKVPLANIANYELSGGDIGKMLNRYFAHIDIFLQGQMAFFVKAVPEIVAKDGKNIQNMN
ncbi:MAG: vWA domain-containing protein [Nitrospinales bacterium]